jgi:hypothetical protein
MLNVRFAFDDAIAAVSNFIEELRIPSLPATVFLMQGDVVNSYRHALNHYLTVPLSSHFLQNSSFGSPYEKWAHFTNEDFSLVSFAVHNLLRYTSRLFHETEALALQAQGKYDEFAHRSNAYTSPILEVDTRHIGIGLVVQTNTQIKVHSVRRESQHLRPGMAIQTETVSILDRSCLFEIRERGMAELNTLEKLHGKFAQICRARLAGRDAFESFDSLIEHYWI